MWASNEPRRFLFFVMIIERKNLWNSSHNSTHWNILHFIYFTCYKMENILSRWLQETYLSKFGSTTATFLIHSRDFFIHSTFFRLPSFIIYRFFELICEKKITHKNFISQISNVYLFSLETHVMSIHRCTPVKMYIYFSLINWRLFKFDGAVVFIFIKFVWIWFDCFSTYLH